MITTADGKAEHSGNQTGDQGKSHRSKGMRWSAILTYGFSAACLIALVWLAGKGGFQRLADPHWGWLAASVAAMVLFLATSTLRYDSLLGFLRAAGRPGSLSLLYATSFGFASGLFLATGMGQVMGKPGLLRAQGSINLGQGVYASLVELLLDLALGVTLLAPILIKVALGREPFAGFNLVVFFLVAGLWTSLAAWRLGPFLDWFHRLLNLALRWVIKIRFLPRAKLEKMLDQGAWQEMTEQGQEGPCFPPPFWSLARVVANSLRLYCLALAFDLPIAWEPLLLGVSVAAVSMILAFTPGSLGFMDAGWLLVLSLQGVPVETILTFLLALRATNYLFWPLITLTLRGLVLITGRKAAEPQQPIG